MPNSPFRVLIGGGGVAGLEALMALRGLAGDGVAICLVAPEDEFVYRPVSVEESFTVGRAHSVGLRRAAQDAGAEFVPDTVEEIDSSGGAARLSNGDWLPYDALLLAVGAEAMPALDHVITWDDRSDSEMLGNLLRDVEQGYAHHVAVVIPRGPGWPLRGYELALLVALHGYGMSVAMQTTLVRPDPPPLARLGERTVQVVAAELARAQVSIMTADEVLIERADRTTMVLEPSGRRLQVDRILALPILRGRSIAGIPSDEHGLIEIDEHCRARGGERIWAAGDCTAFPLKSGGISAAQADVAARGIAALAGASVEPSVFDPQAGNWELAGLPAGRFLEEYLAAEEPGLALHLPTDRVPLLTYLRKDLAAGWRGYG